MKNARAEAYAAIDSERDYQQQRWGEGGESHTPLEYLAYIQDYTAEAMHRLSRQSDAAALRETQNSLRKIAALAVCALELHGALPREKRS